MASTRSINIEVAGISEIRTLLARLAAVADAAQAVYHQYHTGEGLRPEDPEWTALGDALYALDGERG